jgi:hypothetical protein
MITADIEKLAADMVRDIESVSDPLQDFNAIELAVERFSLDHPKHVVEDVIVVDSGLADLPSKWQLDFSQVKSVEYPIGESPRVYMDGVATYEAPDSTMLDLDCAMTGTIRVSFTVRHVLDDTASELTTIPKQFKEPLACYAAHLMFNQLASQYAHSTDAIIQADSVDHADKSRKFSALAKQYLAKYVEQVGKDSPEHQGGVAMVNWDRERLNMPRRRYQ